MINDLLDLARLESRQTRQGLEVVSPATLIEDAIPDLRSLAEAHDARLVVEVAPDLPDITIDSRQIHHVFSNLVGNAARFSKTGDEIALSVKPVGHTVRFSVADHGPGIPKEFQSRVFERFFRIPGTEESNGVGLGLAIAREIVLSHGGSIGLHSTPGEGSEFYFDLPAATKTGKGTTT
jgi:NtrC-family two-component system sensor histidine kinase KinB